MTPNRRAFFAQATAAASLAVLPAGARARSAAAGGPLKFGVGLFQPDREKNDATYRPLAAHLSQRLALPVELRTVDTWEGLAKSLANGETDVALLGPWGYVLAHHHGGAQAVATILYEGRSEYFALIGLELIHGARHLFGHHMRFLLTRLG